MVHNVRKMQRVSAGHGNVQIEQLFVLGDASINARQSDRPRQESGPLPLGQRPELREIVLAIEMAEEYLVDAHTIWRALIHHLHGHGRDEAQDDTLAQADYWRALSYLNGWLTCRRGEPSPRTGDVGEILRMWEICPGLKAVTLDFCMTRFQQPDLSGLNDVQARAALWTTMAAWHEYWLCGVVK